jgi:hypothetical protein
MRRVFLCLLFLLLSIQSAPAAITELSSQRALRTGAAGVGSATLAFPGSVTAGNLLVIAGFTGGAGSSVAVSDSRSTSYTVASSVVSGGFQIFIAWGVAATTGGCTVTVDPAGTTARLSFVIDEFTGQHATPLDVNGGVATGSDASPTINITPLVADDLIVGIMAQTSGTTLTLTPGAGYTQIAETEDSANLPINGHFQVTAATTATAVNWTMSGSGAWATYAVAFKAAVTVTGGGSQIMRKRAFVGQ